MLNEFLIMIGLEYTRSKGLYGEYQHTLSIRSVYMYMYMYVCICAVWYMWHETGYKQY